MTANPECDHTGKAGKLRHSVDKLKAVIEHMNDGLVICNPDGTIEMMNPAALRMHGFTHTGDARTNISNYPQLFDIRDMEGNPLPVGEWPLSRVLRGETVIDHEIRVRNRTTGSTFVGSYSGVPVYCDEGHLLLTLLTIRDVTERKKVEDALRISEENYHTIFDSANDAIFIHDAHSGDILDVNQKMTDMYLFSREEMKRMTIPEISGCPDVTQEEVLRLIRAAGSEGPQLFDWLAKDRNGRRFWVEVSLKKAVLQGEERVIAVVRDISERKEAEEKLQHALAQLTRSNRELEQFAYVASHDLQEPLRMVSGYMDLLEKKYGDSLDDKAHTYIHYAVDGAKRMQWLIEGLLKYCRIGEAQLGWVDTNVTFADATANLAEAIRECGAEVVSNRLPMVRGDATQLLQLFQNLISNAIKYRFPDVAPRVEFSVERRKQEWVFSVRDNGIGISKKDHESVFQIFRRLHTCAEYPGTGIGLASCKKIVEQHRGRIWVESSPGQGSTFFFTIPLIPP